jgi:hypothetical protein
MPDNWSVIVICGATDGGTPILIGVVPNDRPAIIASAVVAAAIVAATSIIGGGRGVVVDGLRIAGDGCGLAVFAAAIDGAVGGGAVAAIAIVAVGRLCCVAITIGRRCCERPRHEPDPGCDGPAAIVTTSVSAVVPASITSIITASVTSVITYPDTTSVLGFGVTRCEGKTTKAD